VQSELDDVDSRVSDLEGLDAETQLADQEDRLSTLESFKDSLCSDFTLSDISEINDLSLSAC
jgi:hypothetical protein